VEGRRARTWVYGKTQKEAASKLAAARRAHELGLTPGLERLAIAEYLRDWLTAARPTIRPATYLSYRTIVDVHLIPALGRVRVVRLTPGEVETMLAGKLAAGLSPRRVQLIRATLRRALARAEKHGIVGRNVAALADGPAQIRREVQPLSPVETRAFLEHVRGHRLEGLFVTAIGTGMRQGELLGLSWADLALDADPPVLTVRHALQRVEGRLVLVEPKSSAGRRVVTLPAFVVRSLREHRRRQLEERVALGPLWAGNAFDAVFVSEIGTPLDGTNVLRQFQRLLVAAGLPRKRFHDLRHGLASAMLAQGVAPRVVMETLGHSTIALTMNTYSHVIDAARRDAADRIDAFLGPQAAAVGS
jgi:integrase